MFRGRIGTKNWAWSLLLVAGLGAAEVNVAPDAVTQATQGYNTYEGELGFLTDGLYPGNSEAAGVFSWPTKGNLVFQFDAPRPIAGLRLYVGEDAGGYSAVAYRGARFGVTGQTEMPADAVVVADAYDYEFAANTWVGLAFPPGTEADYVELITESGADLYEVEILAVAPEPTAVQAGSWGAVKGR